MDTLFVGQNYIFLPETPSTNSFLNTLITERRLAEGTVISSGFQSSGKGQAGNTWEAAKDENIMISVLLYPRFLSVHNQFLLSKCIALAIFDFLTKFLPTAHVRIKWPNDILVSASKICGVLIENGLKGEQIEYSIVGIGINVNEISIDGKRTSMKTITGLDYDLRYLEKILFSCIEARYLQMKSDPGTVSKDYLSVLYGFGEKMKFKDKIHNVEFEGIINGIHADGRLIIGNAEGDRFFN